MSRNSYLAHGRLRHGRLEIVNLNIVADGRFFGLRAGDWTVLLGGFGSSALAVLLLRPAAV
jgi:hypothetical protein